MSRDKPFLCRSPFSHRRQPEDSLRRVYADPTHLPQGICVKAHDAMPAAGVLTLSAANYAVDAAFAQANLNPQTKNSVAITVADTGVSISSTVRDRIFEPFFTTKAVGQGMCLGGSTVLGLVKNMGGFLQVLSEVSSGSQLKVYLPATSETSAETQQPLTFPQGNEELILIVDDERSRARNQLSTVRESSL
ncbi:MAG: ATP-binding protein [Leptolyngbya sp. BL-A-14]